MRRLPYPPAAMTSEVRDWARQLVETIQPVLMKLDKDGQTIGDPVSLPPVSVAELSASPPVYRVSDYRLVFVVDVTPPQPAYSDGVNWRKLSDHTVIV